MSDFSEIMRKEFNNRSMEHLEGFYTLCDFLQASSNTPILKRRAIYIIQAMQSRLDDLLKDILK